MSFEFVKKQNKPTTTKEGIYLVDTESSINTKELNGLDYDIDLERFSLGNWNSIRKYNKVFPAAQSGVVEEIEQGRPVRLKFEPKEMIESEIPDTLIESGEGVPSGFATPSFYSMAYWAEYRSASPEEGQILINMFLSYNPNLVVYNLLNSFKIDYNDGFGYIQERTDNDFANNKIRIKLDPNLRAIRERILNTVWEGYESGDNDHKRRYQLYFEGVSSVDIYGKNPTEWGDGLNIPPENRQLSIGVVNGSDDARDHIDAPMLSSYGGGEYITLTMDDAVWNTEVGERLGYPNFSTSIDSSIENTSVTIPEVDFKVMCFGGVSRYSKDLEVQPGLTTDVNNMDSTGYSTHTTAEPYQWYTDSTYGAVLSCGEGAGYLTNKVRLYSNTDITARFWIKIPNDDLIDGNTYKITGFGYTQDNINPYLIVGTNYFQGNEFYLGDSPAPVLGNFEISFTADFEKSPVQHYLFFYIPGTDPGQEPGAWFTLEDVKIFDIDEYISRNSVDTVLNRSALLYYNKEDPKFIETSYPLKVYLGVDVFGEDDFTNAETELTREEMDDAIERVVYGQEHVEDILNDNTVSVNESVFYYEVVQWGDEDVLLSDDDILNSEYFSLYKAEETGASDKALALARNSKVFRIKKLNQSQVIYSKPIVDGNKQPLLTHAYSDPGVKSIKIIVYRYIKNLSLLIETILVTKNIVINDGILLSQDFEIFGGTDFDFLPLKDNEVIIGGLDENSKYNGSTEKIADGIYDEKDFLTRKTNLDFLTNFKSGLFGKSPSLLDLNVIRVFKGTPDIYDFLMTEDQKDQVVQNDFPTFSDDFYGEDDRIKIDSEATDIFINDGDSELKQNCMIEINPQKLEYLTIPNTVGNKDKGILIGDYKLKKEEGQPFQKEGAMQIPLLEENKQKQAF